MAKNTFFYRLLLLLSTASSLVYVPAASGQPYDEEAFEKFILAESKAKGPVSGSEKSLNTANYDLTYHRLEWTVNPAVLYISGKVTSYFKPLTAGFNTIYFDLRNNMTVTSVKYHGIDCTFSLTSGHELVINLPATLPVNTLDSVTVEYNGTPMPSGFTSFASVKVCSSTTNNALWTLSEPYGARDWWPCKQDLNDKIDNVDIYVTVPSPNKVASNGLLVSTTTSGSDIIYHWKHQYPIPAYLIAIAVADYSVYSDYVPLTGGGNLEILNYIYPCNLAHAQANTPNLIPVMQFFISKFGDYPFTNEKYGHANVTFGGGMEHTTMSFMGPGTGGFSHLLMSHELAHQWFGDQITCQSWRDIWLNEGFATYLEGITYQNGLGPSTWTSWKQGKINNVTSQPGGSVWVDDTTSVGRIFDGRLSYNKGALLLHMLRWKMGDTNFFQAINNYLSDPSLAYGYATTADLKAHLEAVSGMNLTEFFNDWFTGQGYPTYTVSWSQNAGQLLTVQLHQTTSHSSVSFFEMPVPVKFSGVGKEVTLTFDHTFSGQVFTQQLDFNVTSVSFDPDLWLCAKSSVVLPVEVVDFKASLENDRTVSLTWTTASEINTEKFEIERSIDGTRFESIHAVEAQGFTSAVQHYRYFDQPNFTGSIYYRLKMVDLDGSFAYSRIVTVQVAALKAAFQVYPNPGRGKFHLAVPEHIAGDFDFSIFNALGLQVYKGHISAEAAGSIQEIDLSSQVGGIYFLKINSPIYPESVRLLLD
jgi:hypothetical protein